MPITPTTIDRIYQAQRAMCIVVALHLYMVSPSIAGVLSVTAELSPLNIELIDLDVSDGITPSFRWTQDRFTDEVERSARGQINLVQLPGTPTFSDPVRTQIEGDITITSGNGDLLATNFGNLQGSRLSLRRETTPGGGRLDASVDFNLAPSRRTFGSSYSGSTYTFELSPQTAVVFSATYTSSFFGSPLLDGRHHFLDTYAMLEVGILDLDTLFSFPDDPQIVPNTGDGSLGTFEKTLRFFPSINDQEFSTDFDVSLRFENDTDDVALPYFYSQIRGRLQDLTPAIPEPTSVSLFVIASSLMITINARLASSTKQTKD